MLFLIADWFECAGPMFDQFVSAVRMQAEEERRAASFLCPWRDLFETTLPVPSKPMRSLSSTRK